MLATLYVLQRLDDEALPVICVRPARLARPLVVKHVGVGDEAVCLDALDLDAKDATCHHHPNL